MEIHNKQKSQNAEEDERHKTTATQRKLQQPKELRKKVWRLD